MATLWSASIRAPLNCFARMGIDRDEVARAAGFSDDVIEDPDARVAIHRGQDLWREAQRLWGRDGLGLHAGSELDMRDYHALGFLFFSAETVAAALEALERWFAVVSEGVTTLRCMRTPEGDLHVRYEAALSPAPVRDYFAAGVTRQLIDLGARPSRIELHGEPQAPHAEYERVLGCEVEFGAAVTMIVLDAQTASQPVAEMDARLRPVLERELERITPAGGDGTLVAVRRGIAQMLPSGAPSLDALARRLGLSPRTLQRRLADRGLSFSEMVADTRRELALAHVGRRDLSIDEVAYLVGYSDRSAFSRAFKRWTGESPAAYRQRTTPS